jgi:hypothetical protein
MQMKGSGPLHCDATMHRCAAACAGAAAPTSALTATAAANNSEVFDKVLIMISPSDWHIGLVASGLRKARRGRSPRRQCPAIEGYKSISFKCTVAKIHIESARKTLRVLLYLFARDEATRLLEAG